MGVFMVQGHTLSNGQYNLIFSTDMSELMGLASKQEHLARPDLSLKTIQGVRVLSTTAFYSANWSTFSVLVCGVGHKPTLCVSCVKFLHVLVDIHLAGLLLKT